MVTHDTWSRKIFVFFNYLFFICMILLCAYPVWYVLIQSLSGEIVTGKALLLPNEFTFENYGKVFSLKGVFPALGVSIARTVSGTIITVFSCMLMGYLFSKKEMPFHNVLYRFVIITMYVSGGLIPVYLTMKLYGLLNTFWIYILPSAVSAYYIILIKSFIEQLPEAIEESAKIDGAGTMTIFIKIIAPMSMPIIATIAVYASVAQWNNWFDNYIYNFTTESLTTLQYLLYNYLNEAERLAQIIELTGEQADVSNLTPKAVRMTITMITIFPVLMIYPFMQRYFVKGITLGAVKG